MESFQTKNLDRGHLTLFGEVDDERIQTLIEQLLYLELRRSLKEITLWINSAGGLLQPAFGLADLMEYCQKPIRTIGLGTVESAATVLLMAGTPGRRLLARNASVMLHQFSWANSGSLTEMEGRLSEIKNTARKQVAHLARCTGKSTAEVRALLKHQETWLTPEAAIEWGIVDRVLDFNALVRSGVPKVGADKSKPSAKGKAASKKSSKGSKSSGKKAGKAQGKKKAGASRSKKGR